MILGAQLYTVREFTQDETSLDTAMAKISDMGYTSVQVSAFGPIAPVRIREICDKHHLTIAVTHTAQGRIRNETAQVIEEHRILGARHIGIGSMPQEYRTGAEGVDRFIQDFSPAAKTIARSGLKLHYHNHDFEFERFEGQTLLQRLADGFTPETLGFILDTFWVQAGGGDPAWWIRHLAGRMEVVHLKDMAYSGGRVMTPVGEGNMNFSAILEACSEAGTEWLMVEQDTCVGSPFDCLKSSYDYLVCMGYR